MTPAAEAMLNHAGARSSARAKLDHHRVTAFGYRHTQQCGHRSGAGCHGRDPNGIAEKLAQEQGVHHKSSFCHLVTGA
jgi:hypothetical protein